jgi:hypothetical protein
MFFAHRTRQRMKLVGFAVAAYVAIVAAIAALNPQYGVSFFDALLRWFVIVPVLIGGSFALEFAGTRFLDWSFLRELSSAARIALVVLVTVALLAGMFMLVRLAG